MGRITTPREQARSRANAVRAREAWRQQRWGRIEDYLFIHGDRMTAREAAERLRVSERTIVRYRAALRETRGQLTLDQLQEAS